MPHHPKIRPTTQTDVQAIQLLLEQSYSVLLEPAYNPTTLAAALPLITRANPTLLTSGTYYIAESPTGEPLGCGGWTHEQPGTGEVTPGTAHIRHFAVHPNHTGQGVGRAIYNACEQQAKADGVTHLECFSTLNAETFYRALGFETIATIDVKLTDQVSLPGCHMKRPIN